MMKCYMYSTFYVLCCEKFTVIAGIQHRSVTEQKKKMNIFTLTNRGVIAGLTLYGPNSFFQCFSGHNLR